MGNGISKPTCAALALHRCSMRSGKLSWEAMGSQKVTNVLVADLCQAPAQLQQVICCVALPVARSS